MTCSPPTESEPNGAVVIGNMSQSYLARSEVKYSCPNDSFIMKGNNTSHCKYSGYWSGIPQCILQKQPDLSPSQISPLTIVLPLFIIALAIYVFINIFVKCKKKLRIRAYTRKKTYDAFVSYCYEGNDCKFAENTIRSALEEHLEHPFKLCIHRRNFLAAWNIMWNINNAIKNSNSAIIVMSQDYLNRLWCKKEFEQCYFENMKDPAFKVFVIMMQPSQTLNINNEYVECFYLEIRTWREMIRNCSRKSQTTWLG